MVCQPHQYVLERLVQQDLQRYQLGQQYNSRTQSAYQPRYDPLASDKYIAVSQVLAPKSRVYGVQKEYVGKEQPNQRKQPNQQGEKYASTKRIESQSARNYRLPRNYELHKEQGFESLPFAQEPQRIEERLENVLATAPKAWHDYGIPIDEAYVPGGMRGLDRTNSFENTGTDMTTDTMKDTMTKRNHMGNRELIVNVLAGLSKQNLLQQIQAELQGMKLAEQMHFQEEQCAA